MTADEGVFHFSVIGQISDFDLAEQANDGVVEIRHIHDASVLEHLLFEADLTEQFALSTFSGVVFVVFAAVALCGSFSYSVDDARELHVDHLIEFGNKFVVTFL